MDKPKKLTIHKQRTINSFRRTAILMAEEVTDKDSQFNRAYMAAMNQLAAGQGLRQLTETDYKEIEHFYGVSPRSL